MFEAMIADIKANKKLTPVVTELFLSERKINISLAFIMQSYCKMPKTIRLNVTYELPWDLPWEYITKENSNK